MCRSIFAKRVVRRAKRAAGYTCRGRAKISVAGTRVRVLRGLSDMSLSDMSLLDRVVLRNARLHRSIGLGEGLA